MLRSNTAADERESTVLSGGGLAIIRNLLPTSTGRAFSSAGVNPHSKKARFLAKPKTRLAGGGDLATLGRFAATAENKSKGE